MDSRYGLTLFAVVILALVAGLIGAQSQSKTGAAPQPTVAPTPIQPPPSGVVGVNLPDKTVYGYAVEIVANPSSGKPGLYVPSPIKIHKGETVIWGNLDTISAHTVTADDGSFDSGVLTQFNGTSFTSNQIYTHKFTKTGRYGYSDYLNPGMHGEVIVTR